jgi:hypothetical protein
MKEAIPAQLLSGKRVLPNPKPEAAEEPPWIAWKRSLGS